MGEWGTSGWFISMYPTFLCVIHLPSGPLHHLGLGGGLQWDSDVESLSLEPFPLT